MTVVVVGTVVVVVGGGRVVVVGGGGRVVVVVVWGRVVVVDVPRVVPVGEPRVVVVVKPSAGSLVEVLDVELELDDEVVVPCPAGSVVSLVELVEGSTWVPSTSTGALEPSSGRTPTSISTAAAHPASTHQNHRPSRNSRTRGRY